MNPRIADPACSRELQPAFGYLMSELSAPKRGLKPATTCSNDFIQFVHTFYARAFTRGHRPRLQCFCLCMFLMIALPFAGQVPGQLPLEPFKDSGASVTGAFEGWTKILTAPSILVGYLNRNENRHSIFPSVPTITSIREGRTRASRLIFCRDGNGESLRLRSRRISAISG